MTHTLSCVSALGCWQFLDQRVNHFSEANGGKGPELSKQGRVGGLPEPESDPQFVPVMWLRHCTPSSVGPANRGQTGQGTHHLVVAGAWNAPGSLQGGAGWVTNSERSITIVVDYVR